MGKTYELAEDDSEVQIGLAEVRKRFHPVLEQCEVTVAVLAVSDIDEETGEIRPALTHNGYPAAATVKITSLKDRVLGIADAVITLDAATWADLDEAGRLALLDHELCHLQVRGGDKGLVGIDRDRQLDRHPRRDDHGRPVLTMRRHDWQLGGFREIAKRHGLKSLDVRAVRACRNEKSGQYFWDFDLVEKAAELIDMGNRIGEREAQEGATA